MQKQAEFDFDRAEQLGMIERWQPPKFTGVSAAAVKHVLRAIDSHGRGRVAWPSEATLSNETGYSLSTVKRAVKAMEQISIIIKQREGSLTLNHYLIVWTELALLASQERSVMVNERSVTMNERSVTMNERSVTMNERSVMVNPKTTGTDKETTTTTVDVVVVELEKVLAKAQRAVELARSRGLTNETILERYRRWQELPAARRLPGVLYNWLAHAGSYREPTVDGPTKVYGRGDSMSKDQLASEVLRVRIVRAGRAAGASPEQIESRLQMAGV